MARWTGAAVVLIALVLSAGSGRGQEVQVIVEGGNASYYGCGAAVRKCKHAGVVVTAAHVVRHGGLVTVVGADGQRYSAKVLARWDAGDLAIVQAQGYRGRIAAIAERPGPPVQVRGWAYGGRYRVVSGLRPESVTAYLVDWSGRTRVLAWTCFAWLGRVPHGLSGAPLFDGNGRVAGIVSGADSRIVAGPRIEGTVASWINGFT